MTTREYLVHAYYDSHRCVEEVSFWQDHTEAAILWDVRDRIAELKIFGDSWKALTLFHNLFTDLANCEDNITPDDFVAMLEKYGFRRYNVHRDNEVTEGQ